MLITEIFYGVWISPTWYLSRDLTNTGLWNAFNCLTASYCLRLVLFTRCCHWFTALSLKDKPLEQSVLHTRPFLKRELTESRWINFFCTYIFCSKAPSFNPAPKIYARSKKNLETVHSNYSACEGVSFMPSSRKYEIAYTSLSQEEHVSVKRGRLGSRISSLGRNVRASLSNNQIKYSFWF